MFLCLGLCAQTSVANARTLDLLLLPDGYVRLNNGPELDRPRLRAKLIELNHERPPPDIHLSVGKTVKYDAFAELLSDVQRVGYRGHLDLSGLLPR
jgi:biopolymer transport protein ExbD